MNSRKNSLHYIGGCIHQAISYKTILVILGIAFCICLDTWNQLPFLFKDVSGISVYYYIVNSLIYGGHYVPYVVPMLSVLVFTTSYCKEMNNGMDFLIVGRLGSIEKYAGIKVLTSSVGGGIISMLGFMLFVFGAGLFKPLYDTSVNQEASGFPYFQELLIHKGIGYFMIIFYLVFLSGMLWNSLALLCSAYLKNMYATVASPLLIYYILQRIYSYLGVPREWRLDCWLNGISTCISEKMTLLVSTLTVCTIILFASILFWNKIKQQMEGGKNDA